MAVGAVQEAAEALETVVSAMPGGGERRPGGLPPFRRTIDLAEVEAFLADIRRSAERPARG